MQSFEAVVDLIHHHQKFVLTTHVNPDGDGLGSEIALAEWLTHQGKGVRIINHSGTPDVYRFLDPGNLIHRYDEASDGTVIDAADVIVVMDANHPERLRSMTQRVLASRAVKVCIDHHLDAAPFAETYFIDEDATSTGEIVYRLLARMDAGGISAHIATALYCAIMTDTGSFRYPRVDAEIHRIIAHLIECGADPVAIYHQVYEQWTAGRITLLGETLASLKTEYDGRVAHVVVTQDVLKHTGTMVDDTDNFSTYPMSIAGVVAGILFVELADGVKISFRSRGDIPINELAKEFGGNGHRNAAGARVQGMDLRALREKVIRAAAKYVNAPV